MAITRAHVEALLEGTRYAAFEEPFGIWKGIIVRDAGSESFHRMGKTWRAVWQILKEGEKKQGRQKKARKRKASSRRKK